MAYSTLALVSLEKTIDHFLHHNQFSISPHEKQQILSLDRYVVSFLSFLEDFGEKAKPLAVRMRDVAVEAEDVIEWHMWVKIRDNCRYTLWIAKVIREIKFIFQLRRVIDQMDSMAAEVVEIKNSIIIEDAKLDDPVGASSSSSQDADAGKRHMVGLDEDLLEITAWLCGDSRQLQTLPITGMGGIGKTTLARNAFEHPLIMKHFDIRVWVTISQDYSKRRLLSGLLDAMKEFDPGMRKQSAAESSQQDNESRGEESNAKEAENSQPGNESRGEESNAVKAEKVHKILIGRKFLIVMDDVWSTEVLDGVRNLFPNYNDGSRVLLTTRLADVASYAASSTPSHEMRLMDADQSWNLLRQEVFGHQDDIPPKLETIGREIARSCGGLPLAMVVAAGVLSTTSRTVTSWSKFARDIKSSLATKDEQIEKILSSSYNHLPHHLRPCFLYMGGFPEDHEIKVNNLIKLWIAEVFVKPVASKSFEEIAEKYLEDLIRRSLVVVSKRKSNGKIKSCSLHDLVRDLCIKQSHEEKFIAHVKGRRARELLASMKHERRISVSHSDLDSVAFCFSSTIRTILYFEYALKYFGNFRLLRVLDVLRVRDMAFFIPDQFFELFHLRYLAFCYRGQIPRAISNLQSLQTLIIKTDGYLYLNYKIWDMPQLRHLIILADVSTCYFVHHHGAPFALNNLQTLGKVRNLICSISLLHLIPNLKKLSISYYWGSGELLFHNLVHLRRLEKLKLEMKGHWDNYGFPKLVVPTSLKKLALTGWGSNYPYLKIPGPLPNLEVLKLRKFNFRQQTWDTSDEDFPNLRFLLIAQSNLNKWNTQGSHFPLLERLLIHSCRSLNKIPDSMAEIPTLKLIEIKDCEYWLACYVRLNQEEQRSYGDDVFEFRSIGCRPKNEQVSPPRLGKKSYRRRTKRYKKGAYFMDLA